MATDSLLFSETELTLSYTVLITSSSLRACGMDERKIDMLGEGDTLGFSSCQVFQEDSRYHRHETRNRGQSPWLRGRTIDW